MLLLFCCWARALARLPVAQTHPFDLSHRICKHHTEAAISIVTWANCAKQWGERGRKGPGAGSRHWGSEPGLPSREQTNKQEVAQTRAQVVLVLAAVLAFLVLVQGPIDQSIRQCIITKAKDTRVLF